MYVGGSPIRITLGHVMPRGIERTFDTETVELLSHKYKGNTRIKMNPVELKMMIWTDIKSFRVEPTL